MNLLNQRRLFLFLVLTGVASAAMPAAAPAKPPRLVIPQNFAGVALVSRGSNLLLFQASGNVGGHSIREGSKFWIASAGKQFVAAAIMKLADAGKLRLDDPLVRFFPDAPADKAPITIGQLLSHTSGFDQSYVSEEQTDRAVAVQRMLSEPLRGSPGDKFRYSNINIQLAAAIVEIASGMNYGTFIRRNLWRPAGLRSTGLAGDAGASSVTATSGELPPRLRRSHWGEQGVYSTAPDLVRWYRALTSGKLIHKASLAKMFTPTVKIGEGYATAGWFRGKTERGNDFIFVRGNEDFGANSLLYAFPNQGVVIVVLTHTGDVPGRDTSWSRFVLESLEKQLKL